MATLLESCQIGPSAPSKLSELALPLTFCDFPWIFSDPIRRLLFYEFPCSKSHFTETLIPNLKQSLSLSLKHYTSLAGNFLYPQNTKNKPIIKYVHGDSVSLTFMESNKDFDNLVGNQARDADQFYNFVPEMPPVKEETEFKSAPVLALKVTLFPGKGICIGFSNHHIIGDASSIVQFITSWASISKLGGDDEILESNLPLFNRSVVKDPLAIDDILWNGMKQAPFHTKCFPVPTGRVRATFILKHTHISKLKELVMLKYPELKRLSSFIVAMAYVWRCFVKSSEVVDDEDEDEMFLFAVDARPRVDPPVPANYFGNCLSFAHAKIPQCELLGSDGFVIAAKGISDYIKNKVNNKDEIFKGAENWMSKYRKWMGKRVLAVSGSPKFDLYSTDFGFGTAKKLEAVTIDGEKYALSLCKSRDFEGGLEVGFSLPKERMESFEAIFNEGLMFS